MNTYPKGLLITLEGIDGSGKSTLAQGLYRSLQDHYETILTRQPGGTPLGSLIRNMLHTRVEEYDPKAEYLLFAADRAHHVHSVILPALARGAVIICDRYSDSSLAYQGYGRGLDTTMISTINNWAVQGREPDIIFYIALDYTSCMARITQRNSQLTPFEQEQEDYFSRVSAGFEAIYAHKPHAYRLDGLLKQELLLEQALTLLEKHIKGNLCQ